MRNPRFVVMLLTTMGLTTGCTSVTRTPGPSEPDLDDVVAIFNDDLGPEGETVSRDEVEDAFRDDAELLEAVLADLADSVSGLIARMVESARAGR